MRIFYIGQLTEGGTCLDRMRALQRLGHEVVGFDVSRFQSRYRLLRSAQWRWHPRILLKEINREIVLAATSLNHLDCVWVDKGIWIFPETICYIRRQKSARLIHYTPDSQILINRSRHFFASISTYDLILTTKSFEIDAYKELGASVVMPITQTYCPMRFADPRPSLCFTHDIGFVSDYKPPYGLVIRELLTNFPDIGVRGPKWRRAVRRGVLPADVVKGDGVWGVDYVNALASFKIGLGLLSKYIPEQHTTRSFEIPAAGTFLLAERTDEHQAFFKEGEEAEFFGSPEELVSKAKFYLGNDAVRERVAARGRERCHRSGYDTDSVLGRVLKEIM